MTLKWAGAAGLQSITAGMEWPSVTGTPTIETTIARSNGTAWRIAPGATKQLQHNAFSSGQGIHYYRGYFWLVTAPSLTVPIYSVDNGSSRKIDVRMTSGRVLQLFNNEDSAQIGSDSSAVSTGAFYRLEMKIDSTTLSSTSVEARLYAASDEATLLWNPSGTANLAADPNRFSLLNNNNANLDIVWTDVVIIRDDSTAPTTWAGAGSIVYLRPDGNGANSQWTGSDGNSTDNYLLVDETPPNDATDYVESNTSGQIDDYALSATPAAVGATDTINWVAPGVRFAISNTTGGDPDAVVRATLNGNLSESGNISGAGATAYASYQTTPVCVLPLVITTAGLTKAHLDAATGGFRESATDTHLIRMSAYWLMAEHKASSGTGYTQSVSGALTSDGAIAKQTKTPKAGALTSAGTVARFTAKTLAGTLTSSGAAIKQAAKTLAGVLTSSGALAAARLVFLALGGALTSSGVASRLTGKPVAGALTSSGTLARRAGKSLSGVLTSAGAITRQAQKAIGGALSSSGTLARLTTKALAGALASAGSLATQLTGGAVTYFQDLAGTLTSAGTVAKHAAKSYAGALAPTGALLRRPAKTLSAVLASGGTVRRHTARLLAGTLLPVGALHRRIGKALAGVLDFAGALTQLFNPAGPYMPAPPARRVRVDGRARLAEPDGAGERIIIVKREIR